MVLSKKILVNLLSLESKLTVSWVQASIFLPMKPSDPFRGVYFSSVLKFKYSCLLFGLHIFKRSKQLENKKNEILAKLSKTALQNSLPSVYAAKPVERRSNLSQQEFKEYVKKGVPVIFDGEASDWPCSEKWNFDYLLKEFGEEKFPVVNRQGLDDQKQSLYQDGELITIKDFIRNLRNKNSVYLRFCRIMERFPKLQEHMDQKWLAKMRQCFFGVSYQTFIGADTRKTPWHCGMTAFFFVMAEGEKKWELYPSYMYPLLNPPQSAFGYFYSREKEQTPAIEHMTPFHCHLKKGDILFIPAWMWHRVENFGDTWGVSYRFANIRGVLKAPLFTTIRLLLTQPSFFSILYNSFRSRPDEQFALTPRLYRK